MIAGTFGRSGAQVEGKVWCPDLRLRVSVVFRIDPASAHSRVCAESIGLNVAADFPLDDLLYMKVEGTTASAIRTPAILSFVNDDGHVTTAQLYLHIVDDAPGESRLGRDVLNEWLMVYDAPGGNLLFETA